MGGEIGGDRAIAEAGEAQAEIGVLGDVEGIPTADSFQRDTAEMRD